MVSLLQAVCGVLSIQLPPVPWVLQSRGRHGRQEPLLLLFFVFSFILSSETGGTSGFPPLSASQLSVPSLETSSLSVPRLIRTAREFFPREAVSSSSATSLSLGLGRPLSSLRASSSAQRGRLREVSSSFPKLASGLQYCVLCSLASTQSPFSLSPLSLAFGLQSSQERKQGPGRSTLSGLGRSSQLKTQSSAFLSSPGASPSRRSYLRPYQSLLFYFSSDSSLSNAPHHNFPLPCPRAPLISSSKTESFSRSVPHSAVGSFRRFHPAFFPSSPRPATASLPPVQAREERFRNGEHLCNHGGVADPSLGACVRDGSSVPVLGSPFLFLPAPNKRRKNAIWRKLHSSSKLAEHRRLAGSSYVARQFALPPDIQQGKGDFHFPVKPITLNGSVREGVLLSAAVLPARQQPEWRAKDGEHHPTVSTAGGGSRKEDKRCERTSEIEADAASSGPSLLLAAFAFRPHNAGFSSCQPFEGNCPISLRKATSLRAFLSGESGCRSLLSWSSLSSCSADWGFCRPRPSFPKRMPSLLSPNSSGIPHHDGTSSVWPRLWQSLTARRPPVLSFLGNLASTPCSSSRCSPSGNSSSPSLPTAASARKPSWLAWLSSPFKTCSLRRCIQGVQSLGSSVNNALRQSAVAQLAVVLFAYFLHFAYISRQLYVLPVELIPNSSGLFHYVQGDSLAGLAALAALLIFSRTKRPSTAGALSSHLPPRELQAASRGVPSLPGPASGSACAPPTDVGASECGEDGRTVGHPSAAFIGSQHASCTIETGSAPVLGGATASKGQSCSVLSHETTAFPSADSGRVSRSVDSRRKVSGDTRRVDAPPFSGRQASVTGSHLATTTCSSCTGAVGASGGGPLDKLERGVQEASEVSRRRLPWVGPFPAPLRSTFLLVALFGSYILSGYVAWGLDVLFYFLHAADLVSLDLCMHRSLQVLAAHLAWVGMGLGLFKLCMKSFFGSPRCAPSVGHRVGQTCDTPGSSKSLSVSDGHETVGRQSGRKATAGSLSSQGENKGIGRETTGGPPVSTVDKSEGGYAHLASGCGEEIIPDRRNARNVSRWEAFCRGEPSLPGQSSGIGQRGWTKSGPQGAGAREPAFHSFKVPQALRAEKPCLSFASPREGRLLGFLSWLRHMCKRSDESGIDSTSAAPQTWDECTVSSDKKLLGEDSDTSETRGKEKTSSTRRHSWDGRSIEFSGRTIGAASKHDIARLGSCSLAERNDVQSNVIKGAHLAGYPRWYTLKWRGWERGGLWAWWAIAGYFISCLCFNVTDLLNDFLLSLFPVHHQGDTIVHHIMNPTINTPWSFLVGALAPCLSAPWWEEMLYRGFCLPLFSQLMPLSAAVMLSSLLFAAHHMNVHTMLPLWALGAVWATVYTRSGNILVTILIHAMWNSRVFLGNFFDL